ncbi:MAG TPA: hypothetical protein VN317_03350 [Candidatus Methanoperedens sp.]|nr:hypothetical protein [Candidatus Methanoperedens sp.]
MGRCRKERWIIPLALAFAAVAAPLRAAAADGRLVSECIRKVASSSFVMGGNAEIIGVIACAGITPEAGGGPAPGGPSFDEKVRRISKCISRVGFFSDARGDAADAIGAIACVGVVDPDQTVTCLRELKRSFDHAEGIEADILAARACANANPAKETAACVRYVAFRLDADGLAAERLAVQACGR